MPPGIYLQDGGEMSSALGNILGNIAPRSGRRLPPRRSFCSFKRKKADVDTQDAYEKLRSGENLDIPGLTRTLNVNATDPGNPSVAGTVTSLAQPPSATPGPGGRISRIDELGYTPEKIFSTRRSPAT